MAIDRRALLRGLAPTVAFPFLLRSEPAQAALTLRKVGNPIRLGKNQPGGKSRVALSAFDENTFIAGWINTRSFTDARAFVQKRGYNGSAMSQEIQMGGGPLTDGIIAINISVVAFPDGTSLVFFAAQRNGADAGDAMDIFVQRMSASFQKVGNPIAVNTTRAGQQDAVLAVRLKNGNVQVVWFSAKTIRGRILRPNGQPASRERVMVRTKTGTHVPKSLGTDPKGGSLLSYIRFGVPQAAREGTVAQVNKYIQRFNETGDFTGTPVFINAVDDFCGAGTFVGIEPAHFTIEADVAYHYQGPNNGGLTQLRQIDFNFATPAPPRDQAVGRFDINLGTQGTPRVVPYVENNDLFFIVLIPTESAQGNTITGLLVRPQNAAIVDRLVLGPFAPNFLTVDAVAGLDTRFVAGFVTGNDFLSDGAFLQPFSAGAGGYPY